MAKKDKKLNNPSQNERRQGGIIAIDEAQRKRQQKRSEVVDEVRLKKRKEKPYKKKARPKISKGKVLSAIGVVAIAFLLLGISGKELYYLNIEKTNVESIFEEKKIEKEALEKEYAMVNETNYIEAQARERFHMLKEGEILYVSPQEESDNSQ